MTGPDLDLQIWVISHRQLAAVGSSVSIKSAGEFQKQRSFEKSGVKRADELDVGQTFLSIS